MLVEVHHVESYKGRSTGDIGDNSRMASDLEEIGVDLSKTTTGCQVFGKMSS